MATEPTPQPFIAWIFSALGFSYAILLPLAGFACFLIALALVFRGKGPMAAATLLLVVHVPFLIGIFAAIQGTLASYSIIAQSNMTPKPAEIAAGISLALVAPIVGMLLMVPGYAVAIFGGFIRAMTANDGDRSN